MVVRNFEVEVRTVVKELYWISAESEDAARENWYDGHIALSEAQDFEVVDVLEVGES